VRRDPDHAIRAGEGAAALRRKTLRRIAFAIVNAGLVGLCGWTGYGLAERQAIATLRAESNYRLDLFSSSVRAIVGRLEPVPATIQLNQDVLALLREPDSAARRATASNYLRRLNAHLGSLAVYVMNDRGIVIASSNTNRPDDSRQNEDVSFRPYFLDALSGRVGSHFAIGIPGGEPGYFVSHPIRDGAKVVGVAAIKIDLSPVDDTWKLLASEALIADSNQIVILSSKQEWRYTALANLSVDQRVDLQLTRLYNNLQIRRFPLAVQLSINEESQVVEGVLPDVAHPGGPPAQPEMLVIGRTLDGMDWRLLLFIDLQPTRRQAAVQGVMVAVAAAFLVLLAMYVGQRRRIRRQRQHAKVLLEQINADLELTVANRTRALTDANERLRREVAERERAEQTLRQAQDELVHAAKMAILGRLATGITHELTQPLGAIRTLSGNAIGFFERGDFEPLVGNLRIIARMADQMGSIIQPLKGFARKSKPMPRRTQVDSAIANALFLYGPRLRAEGVTLVNHCDGAGLVAWCDPNRLEQVMINLIGNAIDAMGSAAQRTLTLQARVLDPGQQPRQAAPEGASDRRWVRIDVIDTGAGLSEEALRHLFEPFFTTKPSGAGLGLGLVISRDIVREFGGEIEAAAHPGGGARFSVYLRDGPMEPAPE
jgi:two-component system C4-dicarboxylate transport sensor histidine kinase DctB